MRIAVVGGGISGLSAAWLLSRRHEVMLFEANDYIGGHSNTVDVPGPGSTPVAVDTGFIVFNERNYPHLTGLLQTLGVVTRSSDMSFGFSDRRSGLEWAGDNLNSLFAQRRNLLNPGFIAMTLDILRFNRAGKRFLRMRGGDAMSLGEFLREIGAGSALRDHYLLPMAAAIWSCPPDTMLDFPARRFLHFFDNHGLIDLRNRPQWQTVLNGSREYVRRMRPAISGGSHCNTPVRRVRRKAGAVELFGDQGSLGEYDQVVLASHADQALAMIEEPGFWEAKLLGSIRYQRNEAWLHRDPGLMPSSGRVWSSWNYLAGNGQSQACVSYWMNRLQELQTNQQWFVTLNPPEPPAEALVFRRMDYDHPVFDMTAMRAQEMLPQIQGQDRIWFCGSYRGYGFHEDALRSAVEVAAAFDIHPPWQSNPNLAAAKPHREPADVQMETS
ncbi:FAD-dependent oxidoreductase [Methylonatrum kenyense]|uniref:NAD(P)/FAD-dependent oxidoreductase n=1 Tax=Methylonatrum kenyense TaxID=455253 RepID=UPI0020C0C56D|nr:FAD-dependent oxidoreductase [Methylonatrum kenyense]MCK8516617.1 FAD-dependent oxidoreductase [Methylonatrum kenyense]